jgi:tetratricopeptide (TPR) repeat protein
MGTLRRTRVLCRGLSLVLAGCSAGNSAGAAHIDKGDALLAESKLQKAIGEYELALKTNAHDEAVFRLAGAYETAGELTKAEKYLNEASAKLPSDPTLRLATARILAATGRARQAFDEVRRVAQASPGNAEALTMGAVFATTRDEARQAADKLAAFGELQKRRARGAGAGAETLIPLALLYEKLNEPERARVVRAQASRDGVKDLALALSVANAYFSTDRLLPAEELLELAAKHTNKRAATWLRLAAVRVGLHEWAAAEAALRHLDQPLREDPQTQLIAARIQLGLGQPAQAEAIVTRLLSSPHEPDSRHSLAEAQYWLGQARLAQHNQTGAQEAWKEAIELDGTLDTPKLALADLDVDQGRPALAVDLLQKLAQQRPESSEVFRLLGRALLTSHNAQAAQNAFERYAELAPESTQAPYLIATALLAQGQFDPARKRLETALALDPNASAPLRSLVGVMVRQGRPAEAETRVQIELARRGRSAPLLTLLGDVLYEQRKQVPIKLEAAERAYQEAVVADGSYSTAWLQLGNLYAATEQSGRALLAYQAGLEHADDPTELWLLIAQLHAHNGDGTEAKEAYEQVLSRRPNSVLALNNLAYVYAALLNDRGRALPLAERARQLAPDAANVADTYGWILWQQGRPDTALPLLQDAAKRLPESAEAQYHLGLALVTLGQKQQGRAALTRALDLSQTFIGANAARAALRTK